MMRRNNWRVIQGSKQEEHIGLRGHAFVWMYLLVLCQPLGHHFLHVLGIGGSYPFDYLKTWWFGGVSTKSVMADGGSVLPRNKRSNIWWSTCHTPQIFDCQELSLSRPIWRIFGSWSNFSVWPVGAVSKTMVSYSPLSTYWMTLARAVASSMPGIPTSHSWNSLTLLIRSSNPLSSAIFAQCSTSAFREVSGFTSITCKLGMPSTFWGFPVNSQRNASDNEWAGSVDSNRTLRS